MIATSWGINKIHVIILLIIKNKKCKSVSSCIVTKKDFVFSVKIKRYYYHTIHINVVLLIKLTLMLHMNH